MEAGSRDGAVRVEKPPRSPHGAPHAGEGHFPCYNWHFSLAEGSAFHLPVFCGSIAALSTPEQCQHRESC
jgi:hypothetical protein